VHQGPHALGGPPAVPGYSKIVRDAPASTKHDGNTALCCSFEEVHDDEAVNVAGAWCVNTAFSCVPRMFDEKAIDQRLQDPLKRFFNTAIDIMVTQLVVAQRYHVSSWTVSSWTGLGIGLRLG